MKSEKIGLMLLAAILVFFLAVMSVSAQWGTPTQLTFNSASDFDPSISGDGSKIAFESYVTGSGWEICVINSDGTDLTQLASGEHPSISDDGSKIAFGSHVDGDHEIFVVNSDGTGLTHVTSNTAYSIVPSISGDGSKIAFASLVEGEYEIFVVNSDGSGSTHLTSNIPSVRSPSISDDGSKIAFRACGDGVCGIYVVNSDGSSSTQLTYKLPMDRDPSISGDGSKIAFISAVDDYSNIYVINSDGSGLTQLTYHSGWDDPPSISGDGSKIALVSYVAGDHEIFVINSDGTGLTQVTSNTVSGYYNAPAINDDGSKIAFHSDIDGNYEIFVVSYTDSDTEPPTIESVTLDAYTTIPDATIHVTVEATDNVGVTSVTADGVNLIETGSTWEGDITAQSATGDYTLTIRAEDEAENVAETTVDYSVVTPQGGFGVAVLPLFSNVIAGDTVALTVKIISTENFDDHLHVYLSTEGLDNPADLGWFNWTEKNVMIPTRGEITIPLKAEIPTGVSGMKMFRVKAESLIWRTEGFGTGMFGIT